MYLFLSRMEAASLYVASYSQSLYATRIEEGDVACKASVLIPALMYGAALVLIFFKFNKHPHFWVA